MHVATAVHNEPSFRSHATTSARTPLRDVSAPSCSTCALRKLCVSPTVNADIADALDRLAAAPARAVEQIPPPGDVPPAEVDPRFARWSPADGES